ncbi:hypothetical protein K523DRAFT_271410 [Schizophyllum commune Tattone D]|nr:hypothetical protein K523DRAFT_271410 [Schizophyllum commune Tattone D]
MDDSDAASAEVESSARLGPPRTRLARVVLGEIQDMYSQRYRVPRDNLPRPPGQLVHLLTVLKPHRPDKFRENLRVTPATFDKLLAAIQNDPVFYNNSQNDQIDVSHQLAIALYRFGHFGNAVSLQKVANWSGYSKGTVNLVTRRVMTALLRPSFRERCVRRPTDTEKERAKQWVEAHSCKEWRDGYCMVDGTLVPLYTRPYFFGESYFDRKCNYSLNIQVVNTPDLRIIDFGYGFTGSTHDSSAWTKTSFYQDPARYLQGNEFIWADSAYPPAA